MTACDRCGSRKVTGYRDYNGGIRAYYCKKHLQEVSDEYMQLVLKFDAGYIVCGAFYDLWYWIKAKISPNKPRSRTSRTSASKDK